MIRTPSGLTNPTLMEIFPSRIRLTNVLWTALNVPDLIDYTRGPVLWVSPDGQEVQTFQVPIPFN